MKPIAFLILLPLMLSSSCSKLAQAPLQKLIEQGQFTEAARTIDRYLAEEGISLSAAEKEKLLWQKEWMYRVRKDYPYNRQEILQQMQKRIRDFRPGEFDRWLKEGKFDYRIIDGDTLFLYASVSNLFWRYPEIRRRQVPKTDKSAYERRLWQHVTQILEARKSTDSPMVLPQKYRVTFTLVVQPNAVPAGETIRCWLPIPRLYPFQTAGKLLASNVPLRWRDRADSPIRSVYLEKTAQQDQETKFQVVTEYTAHAVCNQIDEEKAGTTGIRDRSVLAFTKEQPPHVQFTPELRKLARQIVGNELNSYRQAKMLYKWISRNILYSYAPEYSTIANLSMYTFEHRYGDCGQEALLFITLCRILDIPARWQSGWFLRPGGKTIHDWTEIYIEPYGWIPVEPYMGIYTFRYLETLPAEQKEILNDFYFGNLDHFRFIANSDHNARLYPGKWHWRSDNVDFQRGEVEWRGGNIYFDRFDYSLDVKFLKE